MSPLYAVLGRLSFRRVGRDLFQRVGWVNLALRRVYQWNIVAGEFAHPTGFFHNMKSCEGAMHSRARSPSALLLSPGISRPYRSILTAAIAFALALGLSAYFWSEPAAPPTLTATPTRAITVLDVVIHDGHYGEGDDNMTNPPMWETPAGGDVIVNVENRGMMEHNWAVVKPGVTPPIPYNGGQNDQLILYGAGMVYSDNRTTITFVAPETPGEYLVICTVENHYPLMQGRLVVK